MIFTTSFILFGKRFELMLNTESIDRNYDDENYAYWCVERDGRYFEVNIWKDENGNFTTDGKVYGYSNYESLMQSVDADEETEIILVAA